MDTPYTVAQVKFNNGDGALLCNGCSVILSYGHHHRDVEHYCGDCYRSNIIYNSRDFNLENITRFEYITKNGRELVQYLSDDEKFDISIQDDGQTMKLFKVTP